ncbi:MAG: hypothetical protein IJP33_05940 [Firmicutes bacterium]|nr:hypothetical protein [Bacillota bacterium]
MVEEKIKKQITASALGSPCEITHLGLSRRFGGDYVCFMGEYDMVFKPVMYKLYNFAEPLYQKLIRKVIWLKKKLRGRK